MRARDVMTTDLVTVDVSTSVREAVELLVDNGFTALPVLAADGGLVGVVTEANLLHDRIAVDPRALMHPDWPVAMTGEPAPALVGAVMTTDVLSSTPNTDAARLAQDMLDKHVRAIPVVEDGKVVGIVTRRDLLRTIARDDETIARDVRHHLSLAFRRGDWSATVTDGVVTLTDEYGDESDRHIADVIARAVAGVTDVRIVVSATR